MHIDQLNRMKNFELISYITDFSKGQVDISEISDKLQKYTKPELINIYRKCFLNELRINTKKRLITLANNRTGSVNTGNLKIINSEETMNIQEINKWKKVHRILVKIRVGHILYDDKEQHKEERVAQIKKDAKVEWNQFENKHYSDSNRPVKA